MFDHAVKQVGVLVQNFLRGSVFARYEFNVTLLRCRESSETFIFLVVDGSWEQLK